MEGAEGFDKSRCSGSSSCVRVAFAQRSPLFLKEAVDYFVTNDNKLAKKALALYVGVSHDNFLKLQ